MEIALFQFIGRNTVSENSRLHKTLNDEIYRHNKNLRAYEELKQKEIEQLER